VTGVAYVPLIVAMIGSAQIATNVLLPRFGPKFMVATGMVMATVAMLLLTRMGLHSSYATAILPALVILGLGLGQVTAPCISVATVGLTSDAGKAGTDRRVMTGGIVLTGGCYLVTAAGLTGARSRNGGFGRASP
jgi:Na+/melibiose symporter-like transporter